MIDALVPLIPEYVVKQRWYAGTTAATVEVIDSELLRDELPKLLWVLADIDGNHYQLLLGGRRRGDAADFLAGSENAWLGDVGDGYWYDAILDPELALLLLGIFTDGSEEANRVRLAGVEQSNSSMIYDDRVIAKLFRRLHLGPNLDVEVTNALAAAGFAHVPTPIATWTRDGTDLAFAQRFLAGGAEGWALALTSVRDLLSTGPDEPEEAGGDFAFSARRLGSVTASLHLAMGDAFGVAPADAAGWAHRMREGLAGLDDAELRSGAEAVYGQLEHAKDAGRAVRVHGDFHLGQTMRTDEGWFLLDFEGEPARPLAERRLPASPLKDVSGMLRSFDYAARTALAEREAHEVERMEPMADAWARRNRSAFLEGYRETEGIDDLLPQDGRSFDVVLSAFELEKAVYELGYELAYRPGWADIPRRAISRLVRR